MAYYLAEGAIVKGDVTIGEDSGIWYHATVRGDTEKITIGSRTNIQDNAVLHVGAGHALTIGDDVTIGHSAIVHGCTVGNNTLIGMGAIILNGAVIGNNCIIGAGALVTQNMERSGWQPCIWKFGEDKKENLRKRRLPQTVTMPYYM